ncbi:MAG: hypothetical protein WKF75_20725 [Singulisphaera sp.]
MRCRGAMLTFRRRYTLGSFMVMVILLAVCLALTRGLPWWFPGALSSVILSCSSSLVHRRRAPDVDRHRLHLARAGLAPDPVAMRTSST